MKLNRTKGEVGKRRKVKSNEVLNKIKIILGNMYTIQKKIKGNNCCKT